MNGRSGTGQVVDLINFEQRRLNNIVSQQLEPMIIEQMKNVLTTAREKIIQTNNLLPFIDQSLT